MKISKVIFLIIVVITIVCCARMKPTRFYVLQYKPEELHGVSVKKPFPYNIQVKEFNIDRVYDNSRIVIRYSAHEVFYDRYSLWALRPQNAVTNLLINQINSLNIVKSCKQRFFEEKPDFKISGEIKKIEKYDSQLITRADLQINLKFIDCKTDKIIFEKNITTYTKLYTDNMSYFAKVISDKLNEEFGNFIVEMITYFKSIKK